MEFITESNRIYCEDEQGKVIAEITFPKVSDNVYCIDHTFVDDSLRGQGIAGQLVQRAVEKIRMENAEVTATCSYAKGWIEKHVDFG
ncbi:MAG: GNAT family N-acetyltransferase [Thermoflexaceae bacterium]|nr:GNAT family N-acetyltransferase [Thermoflexaceae bacterium]